jgi:ATPase subunit of ABC transporter with duplicated ATPase domains
MFSATESEEKSLHDRNQPIYRPLNHIEQSEFEILTQIATQQSHRQSTIAHRLASIAEHDESLDPQSPKFDLEKWLRASMNDISRDSARGQNMGIVFKNLNVYGSGAALQFQETVSGILTAPLRLPQVIRESHSPRRRILKDFNGLLKKSELLLVLGRPGAGCSTFLKALCGELHGLDLDKESVIHYNGEIQRY